MFGGRLDKQRALEQEALLAARKAPARPLIRSLTSLALFSCARCLAARKAPSPPGLGESHISPSLPISPHPVMMSIANCCVTSTARCYTRQALPGHSIARFGKLKPSPRASSSSASSSSASSASTSASASASSSSPSVELAPGDALSGEMSTADAAAVLVEALRRPESADAADGVKEE